MTETSEPQATRAHRANRTPRALFTLGFLRLLPLWAGAIPAGIAYGVAARAAGLQAGEAQLMSVVVFSAAAQVSAASLLQAGTPTVVLVGTVMALNAQLFLLSLTVGRQLSLSWPRRLVTALFLTDGAYGVALGAGALRLPVLLGAGASMFVAWNVGTALGTVVGQAVPDPRRIGLDLVAPLTFLAVLVRRIARGARPLGVPDRRVRMPARTAPASRPPGAHGNPCHAGPEDGDPARD